MHTIDKEQFGRFVAALRKDRGLTQKDLAQQLYLSDKAVSKWETGGSVPDIAVLPPLAEVRVRVLSLDRSRVMVIFPSWMTVT